MNSFHFKYPLLNSWVMYSAGLCGTVCQKLSLTVLLILSMSLDTIYACQDKKDDVKAGVKSITLILQNRVKIALSVFSTALVSSWIICGALTGSGMVYYLVTVLGGGFTLAYDLFDVNLDDPKSCLHAVRHYPRSF